MGKPIVIGILISGRGSEERRIYDPCLPSAEGYLTVRDFDYDRNNEIVPKDQYELVALDHVDVITVQPDDMASVRFALSRRYEIKVSEKL